MWRLKCRARCACRCCRARARLTNEKRLKKRNRKRKYRCFLKMCRSFCSNDEKSSAGSAGSRNRQVSLRSDELPHRSISAAARQLEVCLPDGVLFRLLFSVTAFLHKRKQSRTNIRHLVSKVVSGFASVCLLQKYLDLVKWMTLRKKQIHLCFCTESNYISYQ